MIVEGPTDLTVFLDHEAVFSCLIRDISTRDISIHWIVNETDIKDFPLSLQNDLTTENVTSGEFGLYALVIIARLEYNGTRVQCVAENNDGDLIISDNATLYIQGKCKFKYYINAFHIRYYFFEPGLLASVNNLLISGNISSITISWSSPFSLDVTDIDPDICYSVFIYNITDEPITLISCTDCINITETQYTFTPDYPSPCHKYNFTIIPFNEVGQGFQTNTVYIHEDNQIPCKTIKLDNYITR